MDELKFEEINGQKYEVIDLKENAHLKFPQNKIKGFRYEYRLTPEDILVENENEKAMWTEMGFPEDGWANGIPETDLKYIWGKSLLCVEDRGRLLFPTMDGKMICVPKDVINMPGSYAEIMPDLISRVGEIAKPYDRASDKYLRAGSKPEIEDIRKNDFSAMKEYLSEPRKEILWQRDDLMKFELDSKKGIALERELFNRLFDKSELKTPLSADEFLRIAQAYVEVRNTYTNAKFAKIHEGAIYRDRDIDRARDRARDRAAAKLQEKDDRLNS